MVGWIGRLDFLWQNESITFELFAASGPIATIRLPSSKLLGFGDMDIERPVIRGH